ncbi:hypothetical protein LVB87_15445 [Lysobacter sp. KIS68-7]|uniref:hypothetical protein n=1 Tax=Lysobacter sp. KIS68-7 TaxID=2904252 RepID=UPI001E4E0C83|nr:hypothetical protein [Lysobacter sp. KIS68-7]UHQ19561.1 hypothetical protein LVB87_15445 [Lysobacter sp. KIS68-7]
MQPDTRKRVIVGVLAFIPGALGGVVAAYAWAMFIMGCSPLPGTACEGGALLFAGYAMLFAPLFGLLSSLLALFVLRMRQR